MAWGDRRRRREIREAGFRPEWQSLAAAQVPGWAGLEADERERLGDIAVELIAGTRWEAANGFDLTEEVQATIALQAALVALELPDGVYRRVGPIIVHATTLWMQGEHHVGDGLYSDDDVALDGLADHHGPVVLAWDAVEQDLAHPGDGRNVVIHEFAHQLDLLDGDADGVPPLWSAADERRWHAVTTAAYERAEEGRAHSLGWYAGVDPVEMFAVASEAFFDRPRELRGELPDLYDVLATFYRQDPASRPGAEKGVRRARPG